MVLAKPWTNCISMKYHHFHNQFSYKSWYKWAEIQLNLWSFSTFGVSLWVSNWSTTTWLHQFCHEGGILDWSKKKEKMWLHRLCFLICLSSEGSATGLVYGTKFNHEKQILDWMTEVSFVHSRKWIKLNSLNYWHITAASGKQQE